uniref:Uncharacterized protein n=1 Tax=viral metagenome TaxID=1070528 RepID=A0A6C0BBW6_9ZZZZ
MSVNERFSYVLNELAKVDRFSKKGMPYEIILTIKGHMILEFLETIKMQMQVVDYGLFWNEFSNEMNPGMQELEVLVRLSDILMSLTDSHGSRLLEDGVFEKYVPISIGYDSEPENDGGFIWDNW